MSEQATAPLDLDRLTRLAAEDPEAFEHERQRLVEALIESAPQGQQQRLRGLQWRVDAERQRAATPLAACLRISAMMWERVTEAGGLLDACRTLEGGPLPAEPRAKNKAQLLDFRPPRDD